MHIKKCCCPENRSCYAYKWFPNKWFVARRSFFHSLFSCFSCRYEYKYSSHLRESHRPFRLMWMFFIISLSPIYRFRFGLFVFGDYGIDQKTRTHVPGLVGLGYAIHCNVSTALDGVRDKERQGQKKNCLQTINRRLALPVK